MVSGTGGDGSFPGSDGHTYAVDAGVIGIVSEGLLDKDNPSFRLGKLYTFTKPVLCDFADGTFRFESNGKTVLVINVNDESLE
jgi:hypothetical protein